jgi:hypothetical protein
MNRIRAHHFLCTILLCLCAAQILSAQTQAPLEPAQMPANTTFYFVWRGQPSAELRKVNSIAAMWDDPDFISVRSAMTKALLQSNKQKDKLTDGTPDSKTSKLTREQIDQYASLLENSFVIGYLGNPNKNGYVVSDQPGHVKSASWNGLFFVYDRSGKEAILSKAVVGLRADEKEPPQITETTIADVPALKVQRKTGTTYWIENGKYAVSASEIGVAEEILHRLAGKGVSIGSLADSAAYKEAKPLLGGGQAEFFLRVPDLKSLAGTADTNGFNPRPMLDALKLDAVHSVAGRVLMDGPKTRIQAAALGETNSGSLFDIWGAGSPALPALSVTPADAISYSNGQIDLNAIYDLVKRVATAALAPGKQGTVDMVEMLAQAKLGQPVNSALKLFTGEFASFQTSASLDPAKQVYLIGVRDKEGALTLVRKALSENISSERTEGDVTYLKFSANTAHTASGATAQSDFYHVAATSNYFVISSRYETVHEFVATHAKPGPSLSTVAGFQAARAQFPGTINGFGYYDFRKVDWPAVKVRWVADSEKALAKARAAAADKSTVPSTPPSWITDINPEIFARHLHMASSASWKDDKGLHFDEWIE